MRHDSGWSLVLGSLTEDQVDAVGVKHADGAWRASKLAQCTGVVISYPRQVCERRAGPADRAPGGRVPFSA